MAIMLPSLSNFSRKRRRESSLPASMSTVATISTNRCFSIAAILLLSWSGFIVPSQVVVADTVEMDYRGQFFNTTTPPLQTTPPNGTTPTRDFAEPLYRLPRASRIRKRLERAVSNERGHAERKLIQGDTNDTSNTTNLQEGTNVDSQSQTYEVLTLRNRFVVSYNLSEPLSDVLPTENDYEEVRATTENFLIRHLYEHNIKMGGLYEGINLTIPSSSSSSGVRNLREDSTPDDHYKIPFLAFIDFRYEPNATDQPFLNIPDAVNVALETDYFSSMYYLLELSALGDSNPFRQTTKVNVTTVDSFGDLNQIFTGGNPYEPKKHKLPLANAHNSGTTPPPPAAHMEGWIKVAHIFPKETTSHHLPPSTSYSHGGYHLPPTFSASNDMNNLSPAFSHSNDVNNFPSDSNDIPQEPTNDNGNGNGGSGGDSPTGSTGNQPTIPPSPTETQPQPQPNQPGSGPPVLSPPEQPSNKPSPPPRGGHTAFPNPTSSSIPTDSTSFEPSNSAPTSAPTLPPTSAPTLPPTSPPTLVPPASAPTLPPTIAPTIAIVEPGTPNPIAEPGEGDGSPIAAPGDGESPTVAPVAEPGGGGDSPVAEPGGGGDSPVAEPGDGESPTDAPVAEPGGGGDSPVAEPGDGESPTDAPVAEPGGGDDSPVAEPGDGESPTDAPVAEPGGGGDSPVAEPGDGESPTDAPVAEPGGGDDSPVAEPGDGESPTDAPVAEPGGGDDSPVAEPGGGEIPNVPVAEPNSLPPGDSGEPVPEPPSGDSGEPVPEPGIPNPSPPGDSGEPNSAPPGSRKRDASGMVSLPLYQLSFSIPSSARRHLQESGVLPKGSTNDILVYPTEDDFSMIEFVTSVHIYIQLTRVIKERIEDSQDSLHDLSIMAVKTKVEATHLETSSKTEELQIDLNTTLVFHDDFTTLTNAKIQFLSNVVRSFFVEEKMLGDFVKKVQTESAANHKEDLGFFTIASKISWAPREGASDNLDHFKSPLQQPVSTKRIPFSTMPPIFWFGLCMLILFGLVLLISGLLTLRRRREKKKEIWLKGQFRMENDGSNSDNDTVVFSDSDARMPPEFIHVSEQQSVSTYSPSSLFWPLEKFVYGEDAESYEDGPKDHKNRIKDDEAKYSPSSWEIKLSLNDGLSGGDDELAPVLGLQQERIEEKRGNQTNNNDDEGSQSPSLEKLKMELAEATLEQLNFDQESLEDEKEYERLFDINL